MLRYHFVILFSISEGLLAVSVKLDVLSFLEDKTYAPSLMHPVEMLWSLSSRVEFLHAQLNQSKHDYSLHPLNIRTKRGFAIGLRKIFQYFFDTAMDEGVQHLRKHFTHLITIAATNRKAFNLPHKKLAKLESNIQELLQHANDLTNVVNNTLRRFNALHDFFGIDQIVQLLETSLNSVFSIS